MIRWGQTIEPHENGKVSRTKKKSESPTEALYSWLNEVRGKDKRGKVREVEVSADGEFIAIE
jgi:hypothetical protein